MKPDFIKIPKVSAPRVFPDYQQKIPRIIWQTMKTNLVPGYLKSYADSWIDLNPEYEFRFFDDKDIILFLKKHFPEFVECFKKLKYGAAKADLWRYLIIYKYGGVYADMDCKCLKPLREWIKPEASLVTQLGTHNDLCQWLIISEPGNPIFINAAHRTLRNFNTGNYSTSCFGFEYNNNKLAVRDKSYCQKFEHAVIGMSGPPVMQKAAEECLTAGLIPDTAPYLQVVCVSGAVSCQMNNHVMHAHVDAKYKKALKSLNLTHYNTRSERIRRTVISFINPKLTFMKNS